ncbi:MAG: hypothetical protein DMG65_16205 [Candidatus Angelobacter sp. Gp1-AA117]|nr:MAG: hypothetical protein DMG65_16205 [Candidatus Angelobacter sp. Gp1-AA117]
MANILFVAFHGLICLVDGRFTSDNVDRGFKAYVLRDSDNEHKQMYGDFLAEQEFLLAPGENFPIRLEFSDELQAGPKTTILKTDLNPVVKLPGFPVDTSSNVLAVFTLPRPQQIDYALRGTITSGMLVDQHNRLSAPPTRISAIRFFQYKFDQQANVKLFQGRNPVWECPDLATTTGNDNIAVFHIYNEPLLTINPKSAANDHNVKEFKDSMDFLGADVRITSAAQIDPGSLGPLPPGILAEENAALDVRRKGIVQFVHDRRIGAGFDLGGAGGSQVCGGGDGTIV